MKESAATSSDRMAPGRTALIDAAKRMLPDRAPSTIAGRDLAAEAGVNYGLVHHHFGSKDAVLTAGLMALRDDFIATHSDPGAMPLLTQSDPYLQALVRSNADYPALLSVDGGFPIGEDLVAAVAERMKAPDGDALVEAKARAIAMTSIQLCFSVFGPVLLDATGVRHRERGAVQTALASLYDSLALIDRAN